MLHTQKTDEWKETKDRHRAERKPNLDKSMILLATFGIENSHFTSIMLHTQKTDEWKETKDRHRAKMKLNVDKSMILLVSKTLALRPYTEHRRALKKTGSALTLAPSTVKP